MSEAAWLRESVDALQESFFIFEAERDEQGDVVDLRYRFLNSAAERLLGRPSVEVVGRGLLELFPSVAGLRIFACFTEPLRTGRPSAMRVPSFDANGVVGACPEVRVNLLHQIRPPTNPVPDNPTYAEHRIWARAATDPGQLTMLAGRPDPRVRAAVAGNPATPAPVLVSLYHDPVLAVWTQVKDNSSWPSHVHLGDPFAERGLPWPRSTFHLARALINTRTRLPGCCGRDAVVLATWGSLCPDHLAMAVPVPADRYQGYLARRLITGVWTSTAPDNPGPVDELWRSGPRITVPMGQLPA